MRSALRGFYRSWKRVFTLAITAMKSALRGIYQSWKSEFTLINDIGRSRFPRPAESNHYELSYLEKAVMITLVFLRSFSLSHIGGAFTKYITRSHFSESYVLGWFTLLSALLAFWPSAALAAFFAAYRIADGFIYRLCVLFVDRYQQTWGLRSVNRAIILAMINYIELILGFAIIYAWSGSISKGSQVLSGSLDPLYFSCVTVTTLGDGDYKPSPGIGQGLVVAETMMGLILLALVLGALLTGIRDIKPLRKDHDA